ncbi:MAG: nitric oxide reductase subunit [Campylobacterota bacterium]|nr:nitric oxide reductase subunit [Campylobacterota bacterium]MDQ1268378.1 nitric oxide reductase subunit [Campylobacterota bacterium]
MVLLLFLVGGGSMVLIGHHTYTDSPPMADFVDEKNHTVITHQEIVNGQVNFLKYGLMLYGSMFGDGALRGVDFSADAMHKLYLHMQEFYTIEYSALLKGDDVSDSASLRAKREMKNSAYDASKKSIALSPAALYAYDKMVAEYSYHLRHEVSLYQPQLKNATDKELKELSAFFFWSGWVCSAKRPGYEYSYTHNWPYDKEAGNTPTSGVMLWSVLATLGLIVVLGFVLYLHGRYSRLSGWESQMSSHSIVRTDGFTPTALQKTTYNFFLAAALLFVLQVAAGILSVHNYVGLETIFGFDVGSIMSLITARSWHLQLGTLWITACWIGISIFLASQGEVHSRRQLLLTHTLFWVFLIMTLGILVGLVVPLEKLAQNWNFFGNQGWEFVEMGKLWQWMMLSVFVLWSSIIFTLIYPRWSRKKAWNLPNWLFYCILSISLLFLSAFVAKPETNFVIADFWRWAVIHMWVEAFFEVFATIVVVYMMHLMGFLSQAAASRIVYLAALLFLGTGLLGISHNFYWNAKPIATLALGSIFSTLQVVPLILVALEAWKFRNLPNTHIQRDGVFSQKVAFAFLLGVNFWNFLGAGVFGFIINLPIVNYYEHGTYLTVNHGHAAFMGVYGNLSVGAMLFVSRYLLKEEFWNEKLLLRIFWSINIGLALMVVMDLFPAGLHQLIATMDHGLWYARSEAFIQTDTFQFLTFSRMIGGLVFVFGGVLPLAYFMIKSRNKISTQKPLLS